jgi:hypothetical protein
VAEITTETMAYTFAVTLAGTVGAAYLFPYVVPMVAPAIASTYAATTAVFDSVLTAAGGYVVLEPRMIGAVTGMAVGLLGGLYIFTEESEEVGPVAQKTTNSVIVLPK